MAVYEYFKTNRSTSIEKCELKLKVIFYESILHKL